MVTRPSILLIDDSPGECELFRLALAQTDLDVTLYTEQDTDAAFRFLESRAHHSEWSLQACSSSILEGGLNRSPTARVERAHSDCARSASTATLSPAAPSLPSLILLDLHLGRQNGCDLLKRLRSDARFATLPVVVFTTSDDQADLADSCSCGANGYVVKPGTFDALVRCTTDLCRYWLTWN